MKHWLTLFLVGAGLLLAGCATTLRTEVTAFHTWPAALPDQSFAFERSTAQDNDLEYRHYESLVREQLLRLGFRSAEPAQAAQLKVTLTYGIDSREVRVVESVPVDPGWYGPPFYDPYFGPPWRRGLYGPFYDPFWFSPTVMVPREVNYEVFTRHLNITLVHAADNRKLYEVTVRSEGRIGSLPAVMPTMIRAAFVDFPGPNGVPRQIDLPLP